MIRPRNVWLNKHTTCIPNRLCGRNVAFLPLRRLLRFITQYAVAQLFAKHSPEERGFLDFLEVHLPSPDLSLVFLGHYFIRWSHFSHLFRNNSKTRRNSIHQVAFSDIMTELT